MIQGGKGFFDEMAYNSCVGESIERYASRKFNSDITIYNTYNNLKNNNFNVINPIEMNIDKDNSNIGKFDKNKMYEWISCLNLKDNKVYLVEASFVFFPYLRDEKNLFNIQITTGLSSGLSYEEAILQGLLEVVERDSYVIKYKTNNATSIVSKDILDSLNIEIIDRLSNENIYCNLLTMNGDEKYYTVHCTTEDKN